MLQIRIKTYLFLVILVTFAKIFYFCNQFSRMANFLGYVNFFTKRDIAKINIYDERIPVGACFIQTFLAFCSKQNFVENITKCYSKPKASDRLQTQL